MNVLQIWNFRYYAVLFITPDQFVILMS